MEKKLGIAFAGFRHGHIFGLLSKVLESDKTEFKGGYEQDENARKAAREKGACKWYPSLDEMLADKSVDCVFIGDYYAARGSLAIKALKAHKHIMADKPLCVTLKEIKEIRRLAKKNDLSVGVMFDMRSMPNVVCAKGIINSGKIGKVNNILFEGQHPLLYGERPDWYFEKGKHGGVINDIAIHAVDLVRMFTDSELKKVDGARTWNFYADKVPFFKDSAQMMFTLGSGAGVIGDVSYAAPNSFEYSLPSYWNYHIWGSKGMLEFNAVNDGVKVYLNGKTEAETVVPAIPEKNYFDLYIESIFESRENRNKYTQNTLDSCEQTLIIQSKAEEI